VLNYFGKKVRYVISVQRNIYTKFIPVFLHSSQENNENVGNSQIRCTVNVSIDAVHSEIVTTLLNTG
jgi:hypothetical protein